MNYIVYKTTCLINTKIYIGIHQQETLDFDGYLGSGLLLNRAVEKYGRDNFLRETLFVCHNLKECRDKERQIVNLEFCQRDDTYNLSIGGTGGNTLAGYTDDEKQIIYGTRIGVKRNMTDQMRSEYAERMKNIRVQPDNKDRVYYNDGEKVIALLPSEEVPDGFIKGTLVKSTLGKIHYNDGSTNIMLFPDEKIPDGYVKGRHLDDDKKFKGHDQEILDKLSVHRIGGRYYNNGIVNVYIHKGERVPDGYVRGMVKRKADKKIWITNGKENKLIVYNCEIPEGWWCSKTTFKNKSQKEKKFCTNGSSILELTFYQKVPIGYVLLKYEYYRNSDHHIKIWEHQKVPDGYVKGMITNKTKRIK